jgi:YidC/Oxa1 family membrane protein insertase
LIVAMVLMTGLVAVWSFLQPKQKPQPSRRAESAQAEAKKPVSAPAVQSAPPQPAPAPETPEETIVLVGDGFRATVSSYGGALKDLTLEGSKYQRGERGKMEPIDLVHVVGGQPYPLSVVASPELGGGQDPSTDPAARAPMRIVSRDAKSVVFEGRAGSLAVKKSFRLTGKPFELAFDVEVSGAQGPGAFTILYPAFMPPNTKSGGFLSGPALEFVRPVCRAGNDTERFDLTSDKPPMKVAGEVAWVGVDQHYFVAAVLPAEPVGTCVLARGSQAGSGFASLTVPIEGGARRLSTIVYAGPKELDTLRGYGRSFDSAVDYGAMARPFALFARGLLYVMRWLEALVRNWGVAIILLTLLVRLALFPLTYKSMQSMNEMRKLQPEVEKLKAKFGEDREKLNQATMQLYQQHKVNPLGGCLPMLLQMPIWFALYAALQTSVELYREHFLWIQDLTLKDPLYVLPILMGASSFLTQKLSPQPADNAQAKMMLYFFPAFFTILMLNVPAGLTLYIFVNNLVSIVQQQVMMRHQAAPLAATTK